MDTITPDIEAITEYLDNINDAHARPHENDACAHAGLSLLDQKLRALQGFRWTLSRSGMKCCKLSVLHFNPIVHESKQTMDACKKTMVACKSAIGCVEVFGSTVQ